MEHVDQQQEVSSVLEKRNQETGNFPNVSYQHWLPGQTRAPSSLFSWQILHRNPHLVSKVSIFPIWWFGLPDISITVRVTIVVPSQEQAGTSWGRLPLSLAQTVFVAFPVKIPHVSHVQSRGERWRHVRIESKTSSHGRPWRTLRALWFSVLHSRPDA